jgi:carbon monoxide dehydrogenase subunit G
MLTPPSDMAIALSESFRVNAPLDRVWGYLTDPREVASCVPGAELSEIENARAFRGAIKVRVGPVTSSFQGRAELTEVDQSRHLVRVVGTGRDAAGGNIATLRMTSTLRADGNATEVRVEASVDLAGRLMQFGRAMVQEVSRQLFAQFASCVRTSLETSAPVGSITTGARPSVRPVRAIPLAFRAMWGSIRRAFGRRGSARSG